MYRQKKRLLSLVLVAIMLVSLTGGALAVRPAVPVGGVFVSEAVRQAFYAAEGSRGMPGMYGFDGDNALPDDSTPVSIIVLFNHQPAATLQAESAIKYGTFMSAGVAEVLAESDHIGFKQELADLFGSQSRRTAAAPYEITDEYRLALNGAVVTVPADSVDEIAGFSSVYAVYPNSVVYREPVDKSDVQTVLLGNKAGNAEGRDAMNADELHAQEIYGEGVSVCVIDTGIDYKHPDFAGAFASSNPAETTTEADLIDGVFYGRNLINDGYVVRADNDPMETTYKEYLDSGLDEMKGTYEFYTYHGTHVAGTVAARGTNNSDNEDATSALGVAPKATLFVYRVFGTYSTSTTQSILSGIEWVAKDQPDIVNMSLGASTSSPYYLYSLAVNNVMLGNEKILFVVSSGNMGTDMFTVSSPATSPLALTVANTTVDKPKTEVTVSVEYDPEDPGNPIITPFSDGEMQTKDFKLDVLYMSPGAYGMPWYMDASAEGANGFMIMYEPFKYNLDLETLKITYDVVFMPNISGVENVNDPLGTGTLEEFVALAAQGGLAGKAVLLRRGSVFTETMEYAKMLEVGAVILVNRDPELGSTSGMEDFRGTGDDYLPFFVINDYQTGISFADVVAKGGYKFSFSNIEETIDPLHLAPSSSRGPVGTTFDIKPDVAAHGTSVLSTAPLGEGDTDYSDAYSVLSGTSMASPHVAGAAALLRSKHPDWTAEEIKVRLMNNAVPIAPYTNSGTTISYGVYEQGAGFADVKAALEADTTVTVSHEFITSVQPDYSDLSGNLTHGTGAFSFGTADALAVSTEGASVYTMDAVIKNQSQTEKTYDIAYQWNTEGQLVRNPVTLMLSGTNKFVMAGIGENESAQVTVPAGGTETFTLTIMISDNLGAGNTGSYEGYVTVTETADPETSYSLPFAVYAVVTADALTKGNYFPNRPVISSGNSAQSLYSGDLDFYFNLNKGAAMAFYVLDSEHGNEYKNSDGTADVNKILEHKALLGTLNYDFNAQQMEAGTWYFLEGVIRNGQYLPYTEWNDEGVPAATSADAAYLPEGPVTILVETMSGEKEYKYNYFDIYVDNTPAQLTVNGLDTAGDYNSMAFTAGQELTITGNVYDDAMDELDALGAEFLIWEEGDRMSSAPDQSYTALFAGVDGVYTQAEVDPDTGDFTLTLPASSSPYDVTLYAADGYSILMFDESRAMGTGLRSPYSVHEGFNPTEPGMKIVDDYNATYGFVGSNLKTLSFRVETAGAHMLVQPDSFEIYAGRGASAEVLFNGTAKAGGDALQSVTAADGTIAEAVKNGDGFTVVALLEGNTTVTVTSKNGLTEALPVNVNAYLADGVKLKKGDKVYYGAMEHIENFEVIDIYGISVPIKTYEQQKTPILWEVMGTEQLTDGSYGNLSLLSGYVLDVDMFSLSPSAEYISPEQEIMPGYFLSFGSIRNYLNGGIRAVLDLEAEDGASFQDKPDFRDNFTANELVNIPALSNDVPYYNNEKLLPALSDVAEGDQFFLAWTALYTGLQQWSVFWSAGAGLNKNNAMALREETTSLPATMKNGTPSGYWTESMTGMLAQVAYVDEDGAMSYMKASEFSGVRPGMTLDPDTIIYAKPESGGAYKLTVPGSGIASLTGDITIPSRYVLYKGDDLTVTYGVSNGDYDILAYKIVQNGTILKYGEIAKGGSAFTFDTGVLEAGDAKIYVWAQKNGGIYSNEAGTVSVLNVNIAGTAPEPDKNTWHVPALGSATLTQEGFTVESVLGNFAPGSLLWKKGEAAVTVVSGAEPFSAIAKFVNGDKIRYLGIEKPVSVSEGSAFDGKTWFVPSGKSAEIKFAGWTVAAILNTDSGILTNMGSSVTVKAGTTKFSAIVKLTDDKENVKYIGIERE